MITKLEFLLFYSLFMFFIVTIGGMAGATIVKNAPPPPTIPSEPTLLDYLVWWVSNIGYFFKLMTVSSDYLLFGSLILAPFLVALIYIIVEVVRGI